MTFVQQKKDCLSRPDKSFKRTVDVLVLPLIELLNSLDAYYTTSSCSGRILVLGGTSKKNASFLYVTHGTVDGDAMWQSLQNSDHAFLRQEGFIVHVCCKAFDDATKLLTVARDVGLKRAAIISAQGRIVVELVGSLQMETLAVANGVLIDRRYLDVWGAEATSRLQRNHVLLDKLVCALTAMLS